VQVGTTGDGTPALAQPPFPRSPRADRDRLHRATLFAGFSGGPKGIMPGIAGLQTVMSNHGAKKHRPSLFGFPASPTATSSGKKMRDIALRAGPSFLLNVALNERRQNHRWSSPAT